MKFLYFVVANVHFVSRFGICGVRIRKAVYVTWCSFICILICGRVLLCVILGIKKLPQISVSVL